MNATAFLPFCLPSMMIIVSIHNYELSAPVLQVLFYAVKYGLYKNFIEIYAAIFAKNAISSQVVYIGKVRLIVNGECA